MKELTLEELKRHTVANNDLNLTLVEILGVYTCDNKEYIYNLISAKKDK
jgi:hypothetical protein